MFDPREVTTFFVEGEPRPQPRPRFDTRTGRTYTGEHKSSRDVMGWKNAVQLRGVQAMRRERRPLLEGPVWIDIQFAMPRPKYHFVARDPNRDIRADAPHWHTTKPDRDNLTKAVLDALNGVCWVDDSQVVAGVILKFYAPAHEGVGATIKLHELSLRSPAM